MSYEQLPTELSDMIIDHLHDDKSALRACSLVASAWTHSARNHLFSSVHLQYRHSGSNQASANIEDFLQFGQSTWEFIEILQISTLSLEECALSSEDPECSNLFKLITQRLPKLHTLILSDLSHITPRFFGRDDPLRVIYESSTSLRKLTLCQLPPEEDWVWYHLAAFSHVGELQVLNGGDLATGSDESTFGRLTFPKLGALIMDSSSGNPELHFMNIIPVSSVETSVETLGAYLGGFVGDENIPCFQRVFVRVAHNLKHLRLDFAELDLSSPEGETPLWEKIDLKLCASLQSIQFSLYGGTLHSFHEQDRYSQWDAIMQFLNRIPSPIRSLSIALLHVPGDTDDIQEDTALRGVWDQIDYKLVSMPSLVETTFTRESRMLIYEWKPSFECPRSLPGPTQEFLRECLPNFSKTGKMKFL